MSRKTIGAEGVQVLSIEPHDIPEVFQGVSTCQLVGSSRNPSLYKVINGIHFLIGRSQN